MSSHSDPMTSDPIEKCSEQPVSPQENQEPTWKEVMEVVNRARSRSAIGLMGL